MADVRVLERVLRAIRVRIANLVARVIVQQVTEGKLQVLQVSGLADEVLDGLERFQEYGFTSRPFAGAEGVAVFVGGSRSHGLVIAVDDRRYRIQLQEGEVALYDDRGSVVKLARDGIDVSAVGDVRVSSTGDAIVNAGGLVHLGGLGGKAVARVGDLDSAGDAQVGGSAKVFAV